MARQPGVVFLNILLGLFFGLQPAVFAQSARPYPDELLTVEFPRHTLHHLEYPITKGRTEQLTEVRNSAGTVIAAPNSSAADFLEDASAKNLDLSWSKLNNLIITRYKQERVTVKGLKLACADLSGCSFGATDFVSCDLRAVNFSKVIFSTNVTFTDCNLQGAQFRETWGCGKFNRCAMQGANFSRSQCRPGLFSGCNLEGADFTSCNVENLAFVNTELNRAKFTGATLSYANITACPVKGIVVDAEVDRVIRANGKWGKAWHDGDPREVVQPIPSRTPHFTKTHCVSVADFFTIHMKNGKSVIFSSVSSGFGNDPNRKGWVDWIQLVGRQLSYSFQPKIGGGIHAKVSISNEGFISITSFRDYHPERYNWQGKSHVVNVPNGEMQMQYAVRHAANMVNAHRLPFPAKSGVERVTVEMDFGGYPSMPGSTKASQHPVD
jgi:uncharacterized protein YjbI with pentapeptide repeats